MPGFTRVAQPAEGVLDLSSGNHTLVAVVGVIALLALVPPSCSAGRSSPPAMAPRR